MTEEQAHALDLVADRRDGWHHAVLALEAATFAALDAGCSLREVANVAGVAHTTIARRYEAFRAREREVD